MQHDPEVQILLTEFWQALREDLTGHGFTTHSSDLSRHVRGLPYADRVRLNKTIARRRALRFVENTSDGMLSFNWWAELSGLNPDFLRRKLLDACNI